MTKSTKSVIMSVMELIVNNHNSWKKLAKELLFVMLGKMQEQNKNVSAEVLEQDVAQALGMLKQESATSVAKIKVSAEHI